jgi:hypothetical protein
VESTPQGLRLHVRTEPPPPPRTLQLIEDRVDGTGGVLERTGIGSDGDDCVIRWPLLEAAG